MGLLILSFPSKSETFSVHLLGACTIKVDLLPVFHPFLKEIFFMRSKKLIQNVVQTSSLKESAKTFYELSSGNGFLVVV